MKKNIQKFLALVCVCVLCAALEGCASKDWAYKDKNYPKVSWFDKSTNLLDKTQFKQLAEPVRVLLYVNYTWEGCTVKKDPYDDRTADWREVHGLWLASKRYLEETGLFQVVDINEDNIQGQMILNISRNMTDETKARAAAKEQSNSDEKIVYEFDMGMDMKLTLKKDKTVLTASAMTNRMFIGHEDSKEKALGLAPEKFTFSYFNNMDFHTEFVRRFYKQMLFESLKQIEKDL